MRVQDLMTCDVQCCRLEDDLARAAQIMWDEDCGIVPVIGGDGGLAGVITDRDVCMAAWSRGLPLSSLRVADTMSRQVVVCAPDDDLVAAMLTMKSAVVRRMPVLDEGGLLVGILSLCDLAVEVERQLDRGGRQLQPTEFVSTVAAVSRPRRSKSARRDELPPETVGTPVRSTARVLR